jgi:aspartyl protease family protein
MSTNPVKLFGFIALAAAVAAGTLSKNFEPEPSAVAPAQNPGASGRSESGQSRPEKSGSLWSSWFGGMEFRREAAPPPTAEAQPVSVEARRSSASGFGSVVLKANANGQYNARIEIEGQSLPMLVDTGATVVALRHEDAMLLGIHSSPSDFTISIATANGEIKAARTRLREVRLQNITVSDVSAVILPSGALSQSLLGMSFMNKLSKFEIAEGELILKP